MQKIQDMGLQKKFGDIPMTGEKLAEILQKFPEARQESMRLRTEGRQC